MNRRIKIGYATRDSGQFHYMKTKYFPKIILQGNWLKDAGFNTGDFTELNITQGKIEIVLTQPAT